MKIENDNEIFHLTTIRGIGDLYGHKIAYCSESGCSGYEKFLGTSDNTHLEKGMLVGLIGEAPNAEWVEVSPS